jgi:isopenicillin-N epimerase
VREICDEAKKRGIMTVIDGAHAPGQIPLNLMDLGADFYAGNLHKWLCAPKGAGFLYAHPDHHPNLKPLVVSWGWKSEEPGASLLIDHHEWQGTRDPAAWLAVPDAIRFQEDNNWDSVRRSCHTLAIEVQARLAELTGKLPIAHPDLFAQMVSSELPNCNLEALHQNLLEKNGIEVPVFEWNGKIILRVSVQGYNSQAQIDRLIEALSNFLPSYQPKR